MGKVVTIKSFNGIGDLLFVTPTLRRVKEVYPDCKVVVNTNYPQLLERNPYVDQVGRVNAGVFLGYPDPIHAVAPGVHHIISDFCIVKEAYDLLFNCDPVLRPEIYCYREERDKFKNVGVQVMHKRQWHGKKVWDEFDELAVQTGFAPIPKFHDVKQLVQHISSLKMVVCAEGAISHIARAVETPAVVIFGGFALPMWSGYSVHRNIVNTKSCSEGCYSPRPCISDKICMKEITVDRVTQEVEDYAEEFGLHL
jgi:ADP-heptose:LPS heptosyltransferase